MPRQLSVIGCTLVLSLLMGTASAQVVVVVSARTQLDALTRAELSDIYLGRMDRLPNGEPVIPVDQAEDSPAHQAFYRDYLGRSTAQIKAHWSKLIFTGRGLPPRAVADGTAAADFVAETPNAIGYVDAGLVDDRLQIVSIE